MVRVFYSVEVGNNILMKNVYGVDYLRFFNPALHSKNPYSVEGFYNPFWIFHGDADAVVSVKESRAMVEKLKSLKAVVKYTEYGGVNHNSWDNAFAEPDFMKWLFSN